MPSWISEKHKDDAATYLNSSIYFYIQNETKAKKITAL